ncbi:helix-turn-helix domain-containing protein [Xylanibacillus composti]|uniref:AraC family transcriptional regulator n=1 Tax=Xylanibacillus composti TaxID=1572762 RepID=A0A8J4M1X3_9BACL|nr:helix-turn-helix domain-containing protein [Xylanibacillus composti]MDT9725333.1 helix-turn-helix domain-containing protein [Xylanibacillus composti]GIQ69094.1 AraC family transcriptional regulator [Xylanibacillus composti]
MIMHTCKSTGVLSAFVDYFWYMESQNTSYQNELSLPDGSVDLIIDLTADKVLMATASNETLRLNHVFVCGPHSRHFVICNSLETRVIGIHFKPGGAYPFLGCPLDQLHNVMQSMDAIWGHSAGELREELLELSSVGQMFHVLSDRLLQLAVKPLDSHPAVHYAIEQLDKINVQTDQVGNIVGRIGISHRRFIELFQRETGYTPKRYSRIRRFQEVLRKLNERQNTIQWSDIAFDCGYFDQSHFIKDFRAFSGLNPSDYEAIPGRHYNHVPL